MAANGGAIVAVGQAQAALPAAELATQTKAIGVILPPPDIRSIVDKTAQFVARNGTDFEKRILANEASNQKFNFLKDGDPYNAYYRHKVAEFSAADKGEAPADGATAAAGAAPAAAAAAAPAAPTPVPVAAPAPVEKKPVLPPTKPLEAPEEEQYTVHIPEGLTALDLDTIKLTAQFVARNGKSFLTGLASREHANPQFNFLKPTHSLFAFFTSLCDAYSRVLMPPKELRQRMEKDVADRSVILERAVRRLEWERVQEKEAKEKAAREEAEREAMLSVDWHDFAVVETIEFFDDEADELPPPMMLKDIIRLSKVGMQYEEPEPEAAAAAAAAQQAAGMDMDADEAAMVAQGAAAGGAAVPAAAGADMDMDMDMEESDEEGEAARRQAAAAAAPGPPGPEEEEEEGPMRVVRNYQRPAARQQQQPYDPTKFVVSPITGELIPIAEMAEHMRISLIDPKYREQKEAMMAKIRDTTKASDDEIGRNLMALTRTLPHIFGTTQEEMSALVGKQIAEQRAKEAAAARAAAPVPLPQGPAQPLPPPAQPLPEMPPVAVPPPGMAPPPQAPPPSLPPPSLPPPPGAAPQAAAAPPPSLVPPSVAAAPRPAPAAPAAAAPPPAARPPPPMPAPPMPRPPPMPVGGVPTRPPMPVGGVPTMPPGGVPTRPPLPPIPMGGPPPLPGGPPPLPRDHPPPLPGEEPESKRARTDTFVLQAEEEFADARPGQQKVHVLCPKVEGSDTLKGQLLAVEMPSLLASVADLKARLAEVLGLAPGKQQLTREHVGVLKNELTLAFYNVGTEVQLQLGIKERGGRKK